MTDFYGEYPVDFWGDRAREAKLRKQDVQRQADEAFKVDPMSFLPFVQSGTKLAGGLFDAGKGGGKLPEPNFKLNEPSQLQYFDPQQTSLDAKSPWDELEYNDPGKSSPWWQR